MLAEFGTGQVFLSILWFFLFFIWIMLLFYVFADIFTDSEMGGWGKALWSIFVILVPYLGVLIYLIVRGSKMRENAMARAKAQDQAQREYILGGVERRREHRRRAGQARRPQGERHAQRGRVRGRQEEPPRLSPIPRRAGRLPVRPVGVELRSGS
jgi:ABC-type multidrug transport system fused ATPase/permease subunit